ncbi:hypothetical protein BJ912DRAFT_532114 [Pholiota molesta]|nr:hypothetical protein BJ912DRAFT_532114 [Pholiota molesta]
MYHLLKTTGLLYTAPLSLLSFSILLRAILVCILSCLALRCCVNSSVYYSCSLRQSPNTYVTFIFLVYTSSRSCFHTIASRSEFRSSI